MNDSFAKSCTVQLSSDPNTTVSVNVPVHGNGIHLGYVYVIKASLHTTNGDQIENDLITTGMYILTHVCMHLI